MRVGLQKRVFTGVITLFILGAIFTAPKASQRARSARRAEEGKRQLFPLPRRAPTHTECGFKVLDPKGLDPKGEGSPKIAEIVYNVIKDITTRGDHYDGDNTLIYCLYKNKISK